MLIIAAGMSRSASTWCYQVACELAPFLGNASLLGYRHEPRFTPEMAAVARSSDISVVKSHSPCEAMLTLAAEGHAHVLYSYRDLRDVAFSLAHKVMRPVDDIIAELPEQIAWQKDWLRCPSLHVFRYEAYQANPRLALQRIARFLGVGATDAELDGVHDKFTLAANRDRCERKKQELQSQGCDLADPSHVFRLEHEELVHWNHIRTGQVGQWRQQATPAQIAALEKVAGDWLIEHQYERNNDWAHGSKIGKAA